MQIAIVLYPDFTALDAIGPLEVLSSIPGATVQFLAEQPGVISNDTKTLHVRVDRALSDLTTPDVVLVPGGPGCFAAMQNELLLDWLRHAHAHARWVTSVCTGSLILAAAGLLRGARATTHWASHADLAEFGATYVRERYVLHGTIITAAGVSAGIDMALSLAVDLSSITMAETIQLAIEYDPQPPFPMITPPTGIAQLTRYNWQIMEQRSGRPHPLDPSRQAESTPTETA
jgi:transcriptional regulator GlxA family with amidase domain